MACHFPRAHTQIIQGNLSLDLGHCCGQISEGSILRETVLLGLTLEDRDHHVRGGVAISQPRILYLGRPRSKNKDCWLLASFPRTLTPVFSLGPCPINHATYIQKKTSLHRSTYEEMSSQTPCDCLLGHSRSRQVDSEGKPSEFNAN